MKAKDKPADPIIVHPDVRKMLLTAKAYAEGGRALAIYCAVLLDKVHLPPRRKGAQGQRRNAVAAHAHRQGLHDRQRLHISTNACMQVFGGHGFIKEWGMEQFVRDAAST